MTNFQVWEQHNLARFAREANEKLLAQQKEIEQLREDLRVAIGDHNMNQTDSGWRKRQIALDKKAENARELGLDYEPDKTVIYTTFKQWAEGQFLETGEPRVQAYSKDELALIEMGWGYGYDAGALAEREACAKVCDRMAQRTQDIRSAALESAAENIRARGKEPCVHEWIDDTKAKPAWRCIKCGSDYKKEQA